MTDLRMLKNMMNSLRHGIPPEKGVHLYSVSDDKLVDGVKEHHIDQIEYQGKIRFISGPWGSGKTHLFRLIRELAFENKCLVSNVQLSIDEAPFNKFEMVFHSIIRNIQPPSQYQEGSASELIPLGIVLKEALLHLGAGNSTQVSELTNEQYAKARSKLMANNSIDIDFKKIVDQYWITFFAERIKGSLRDERRGEVLQWFAGEGNLKTFRSKFGINKMVSRASAKDLLQSLAGFVQLAGYRGLVILFDEAEQSYSIMRKSDLQEAHNNLLSIINNIERSAGLFMIYATTPDFFDDPRYGIVKYPALESRVGIPRESPPSALQNVWNLEELGTMQEDYEIAAVKILNLYAQAYPEPEISYPSEDNIKVFVRDIAENYSSNEAVCFWRVMVATLVAHLDDHLEGRQRSPQVIHQDIMSLVRQ